MWGPVAEGPEIRAALLEAGREFGLRAAGARAYSTVSTESGWIASPLPAVYSGENMKPYRAWLKAEGFEANGSLGGSFVSENVEDYYFTPWDLGYGHMVKFDHDFIGRAALEKLAAKPHRHKVTLSWNSEDVIRVFSTQFNKDKRAKFMDMPASYYATWPYDAVQANGKTIGVSTYPVYTSNGREWISTAIVNDGMNLPGTELSVIWGEPDGGSARPTVERHVQTAIRAIVGPCPYAVEAREAYRPHELQL
jgi:glycine cleavage system aminomethyltransferase T